MTNKKEKNKEIDEQTLNESEGKIDTEIEKKEINLDKETDINEQDLSKEIEKEIEEDEEKTEEEILKEEVERLRDEKLRLLADMDNLRKRAERDRFDSIKYGSIKLARDILSPDDNLRRALEAIPEEEKNSETVNNLIDGLKMIQKDFANILEKHGVEKIEALNKKFDHNLHQAMVEIENNEVEAGTIIQEMQSGFTMYDRLLRPSMVGVSKKITKNEEDNKND